MEELEAVGLIFAGTAGRMEEMRWLVGFVLFLPALLRAEEPEKTVQVRLISEFQTISPGKKFYLGLHLQHPPGSHTYWKYPGIVGIATTVKWELPEGFTAGEIEWPAPQIVKMAGHEAQGYEGETLLMIPISAPDAVATNSVTLTAKASWMCCGKTCQPANDVPLSITLAVADSPKTNASTNTLFEKFRARVPRPNPALKATAQRLANGIRLNFSSDPSVRYSFVPENSEVHFFTADGQVDTDQMQGIEMVKNGTFSMSLRLSETAAKVSPSLPGIVRLPQADGSPIYVEIDPKY